MKRYGALVLPLLLALPLGAQEKAIQGISPRGKIAIRFQPPAVSMQVRLQEANGNQALDAGEKGAFKLTASNAGPGKAYALSFRLTKVTPAPHVTLQKMTETLDVLLPGQSKTVEFPVSAAFEVPDGRVTVRVEASEKNGYPPSPLEVSFETRAFLAPRLVVADMGISDGQGTYAYGNGNGRIEKGETVEVRAIIQNTGQGEAGNVNVTVELGEPNLFFIGKSQFALGDLAPGAYRDISFALTVPPNYSGPTRLPVTLNLSEARGKYGARVPLSMVLNESARRADQVVAQRVDIAGRERPRVDIAPPPPLSVDVDMDIPTSTLRRPDAVAVIIGNRDYQLRDVPPVEYALRDAQTMKEYLVKVLGYQEDNIIFLSNATKAQLDATFGTDSDHRGKLYNYVKPGMSEVFVYYSGHGAPDVDSRRGYLVPVDADPAYVRLNGYALDTFYKNLGKLLSPAVTVVLDACFSGASEEGMLLKAASPVFVEIRHPALAAGQVVVFASSTGDQVSSWYPEKRHGLFTYFFLKGLRGEADRNGDRKVTIAELNSYLAEQVPYLARRLHNRKQTPLLVPSIEVLGARAGNVLVQF